MIVPYVNKGLSTKIGPFIDDVTGSIITINNQFNDHLLSLKATIEATQSGSGDPSPDNVRPISGWSSVSVVRCGINLWDEDWEVGGYAITNGQPTANNNRIRSKNYIAIKPSTSLRFRSPETITVCYYDRNLNFISYEYVLSNRVFTTTANAYFLRFATNANYGATYNNDISINYPSTDTSYHAYNGNTYIINLGGTYYGGVLDVTNGVLRVTHFYFKGNNDLIVTLFDHGSTVSWFQLNLSNNNFPSAVANSIMSSHLVNATSGTNRVRNTENIINFVNIENSLISPENPTGFKEWLINNNVEFVYELAEPQTIQLTPTEIELAIRQNTIFADTGNLEAIYKTYTPS